MSGFQTLSDPAKTLARRFFRWFGLEVRRIPRYKPYEWLREWRVRTILDIGANVGQFAGQIHKLLPEATLYSFEPIADCYQQLLKAMGGVAGFHAFNVALGEGNARRQIYRNVYTPSSSLLPMDDLHIQSFPFAAGAVPQEIEVRRLDDLADKLVLTEPILMKIDVQGTEDKVLLGAERVLTRTSVIILETSFRPLYKGQALFDGIYRLLCERGFVFMGSEHSLRDPRDGRVLQCDSVFLRQSEDHHSAEMSFTRMPAD